MKPALRRRLFAGSVLAVLAVVVWLRPGIDHSPWTMMRLFDFDVRVENFRQMERIFPARELAASTVPYTFPRAESALPAQYGFEGRQHALDEFLERSDTTGLLVLRNGVLVHEQYRLGADASTRFTSWSLAKSVVAALVGIAVQEGAIRSLDDRVVDYLPGWAGTAWAEVRIHDLLRMASGIAFEERYDTHFSDIQQVFHQTYLLERPIGDVVRALGDRPPEAPPGTQFHYISVNTQVLAEVLRAATGRLLVDYAREKLWQPLGMQDTALWNLDGGEPGATEVAYCCLNTTLRDYAKFGQLFLQQGQWQGRQLLPPDWVRESTRRPEPWLQPGVAQPERGYGYHWWIPPGADGEYFANGIWGQSIWVDEPRGIVIVKTSVDPDFQAHMPEMIAVMRAVSRGLAPPRGPAPIAGK
ncbi:MAG: serine hydrolase domain-containing protein [Pseudomonadota bacterium]